MLLWIIQMDIFYVYFGYSSLLMPGVHVPCLRYAAIMW